VGKRRAEVDERYLRNIAHRCGGHADEHCRESPQRVAIRHMLFVFLSLTLEDAVERAAIDTEHVGGPQLVAAGLVEDFRDVARRRRRGPSDPLRSPGGRAPG
jgi:hypothetical protein